MFSGEGPTAVYNKSAARRCTKFSAQGTAQQMRRRVISRYIGKGDDINSCSPPITEASAAYRGLEKTESDMAPDTIVVETGVIELERTVV